jgi:hypothetical protein
MIGKSKQKSYDQFIWFAYGKPCVGEEVLAETEKIADLKKINDAIECGLVMHVWPVGSNGIVGECKRLGLRGDLIVDWDVTKSAGPATCVLLGIACDRIEEAKLHFGDYFEEMN